MATILYVDDEPAIGLVLQDTLERLGHSAIGATNVPEALAALARGPVDLIISDFRMPGLSGLELLEMLRADGRDTPLIMLTGYATIEHAVAAIKAGAADYITKPLQVEQLEHAVAQALELTRLKRENQALRDEVMEIRAAREIVAKSAAMRQVLQMVSTAAPTRATVLLQGESGTGKELLARAIHDQSDRRDRAFVKLNCAALPEGLVESALFGHEKGAFTGAIKRVEGAFERAHGGTLLLDEITEMRLDLQAKLLRVLQEQEFERVGGTNTIRVDVRIIATTNRDMEQMVERGEFRRDLFYRLSVMPILIPALRERPEDIPILALHFAHNAATELHREMSGITPDALALLQRYEWPGNVRELQHAVERGVILTQGSMLLASSFDTIRAAVISRRTPLGGVPAVSPGAPDGPDRSVVLTSLNIEDAETTLIQRALAQTGGNRTRAAELLGLSDRTLRNKLAKQREASGQKS
ncbi:MAG TPA: sigma-54 dependent transcriptional regulator [Gemmatimonadaceae bacterium]|nr:sigma-54 dependent transcriptional regulator [Gemmatimonadaceae bacterium]